MEQVLKRAGAMPAPKRTPLRRRLAAMAQAVAERLVLPRRELPPEFFRWPLP